MLLERMMDPEVKKKRRRLGLMLRSRAFRVFPIARYLREHEQQLWIAALQCEHWDLWQMVQRCVCVCVLMRISRVSRKQLCARECVRVLVPVRMNKLKPPLLPGSVSICSLRC